eukprot:291451-Chlamydomonas_euryale.AAC.1
MDAASAACGRSGVSCGAARAGAARFIVPLRSSAVAAAAAAATAGPGPVVAAPHLPRTAARLAADLAAGVVVLQCGRAAVHAARTSLRCRA